LVGLVIVIGYFQPENLLPMIRSLGAAGIAVWVLLTVAARLIQAETTAAPLLAMGYPIRRRDAFWIGWIRTFANQILPTAGVAAYAQAIRHKTQISWSELAVLAAPQYILVAAALGLVGLLATACNLEALQTNFVALAVIYSGVIVASVALTMGAHWMLSLLPIALKARAQQASMALRKFVDYPGLIARVVAYHSIAILLRGGRLWLLFVAAGIDLNWREALLIIAVAESSMLIQLTPGGLGIREGAILGGAALIAMPTQVAAGVALIDRLLVVAITVLMTPPAIAALKSKQPSYNSRLK
jgi:uncharacterized membrane protein YbhN (UPF0104 family)